MRQPFQNQASGSGILSSIQNKPSVGVIELKGVILDSKRFLRQLKEFGEDDKIKSIVLRLNSPGGAVAPSQEIYESLKRFKKPTVTSMGSVAASGAFYASLGTDYVIANHGTLTGSIGVIMQFANLTRLYDWAKIKPYTIKTGKYKDTGTDHRPMRADERLLMQRLVDDTLVHFKKSVQEARKLKMKQVNAVADGRVITGSQALRFKLVDQLGTIDDAVKKAAELGKIDGEPEVVYPRKRPLQMLDVWLGEQEQEGRTKGIEQLIRNFLLNQGKLSDEYAPPGLYFLWQGA